MLIESSRSFCRALIDGSDRSRVKARWAAQAFRRGGGRSLPDRLRDLVSLRAAPATVWVTDHEKAYRFDPEHGLTPAVITREACDVRLGSESLHFAFKFLWGGQTLAINGRFQERERRQPPAAVRLLRHGRQPQRRAGGHLALAAGRPRAAGWAGWPRWPASRSLPENKAKRPGSPAGCNPDMRYRHLWTEGDAARMQLIPALAPWVYSASRPFADWYFGDPDVAAEILHEWMSRPTAEVFVGPGHRDDGARDRVRDGRLPDRPFSGADLAKARAADFAAFCHELGSGTEAEEVIAQVVPASRELFPPVGDDELYISRVAVDPSRRGQGLGRKLVAHTMETFRAQGFRKFRLDVSADNRAAIRAYQAAGLRVVSTSHSPTAGLTYCAMVTEAEAAA